MGINLIEDSRPIEGKIGTIETEGTIYAVVLPNRHSTRDEPYLEKVGEVDEMEVEEA